jgi:hypothetical protein
VIHNHSTQCPITQQVLASLLLTICPSCLSLSPLLPLSLSPCLSYLPSLPANCANALEPQSQSFFALLSFWIGSLVCFLLGVTLDYDQFVCWDEVWYLFCLVWLQTSIFLIFSSWGAGIKIWATPLALASSLACSLLCLHSADKDGFIMQSGTMTAVQNFYCLLYACNVKPKLLTCFEGSSRYHQGQPLYLLFCSRSPPLPLAWQFRDGRSSVSPAIHVGWMPCTQPNTNQAPNEKAVTGLQLNLFHKTMASDLFSE